MATYLIYTQVPTSKDLDEDTFQEAEIVMPNISTLTLLKYIMEG